MPYLGTEWVDDIPGVQEGTPIDADNMNHIEKGLVITNSQSEVKEAGGTATVITISGFGLDDYFTGLKVTFIATADNGGAATTINIDGKGAKSIYKPNTVVAPTLKAGRAYTIYYIGTSFFWQASAEGNAVVANVLAGKTFSNDDDSGLVGTMANLAGQIRNHSSTYIYSITPSGSNAIVDFNLYSGYSGYYDQTSILGITIDNLITANIKAGVKVGDSDSANSADYITGTFTADANATAADIAQLKTAYVNGEKLTGAMEIVENVQRLTVSVTAATQNVTIPTTDRTRSIVRIRQKTIQTSNTLSIMEYQRVSAKFTSNTNIQLQLGNWHSAYTSMTVYLEIITFKPNVVKSLQRGSYAMGSATSASTTIASVDMAKTMIEASWRTTQADLGYSNQIRAWELTSSTAISFYCGSAYPATFEYEAVEFY